MFCSNCGHKCEDTGRFCRNCGHNESLLERSQAHFYFVIFEQKAQNNFIFLAFVEIILKCLCFFIKFCTAGSTKFTVKCHCCGTNFTF